MANKARTIPEIEREAEAAKGTERPEAESTTSPSPNMHRTHPNPERERQIASILTNAWPKIKASMFYLRDR